MVAFPKLRVLHYLYSVNKRERSVAHCLDFDLVETADSREEAERRLDVLVRFHIESYLNSSGLSGLNGSAPSEFWDRYTALLRDGHVLPASTLRINIPDMVPMAMPYGELEVVSAQAA